MKSIFLNSVFWSISLMPLSLFADTESYYCPQNHAYINIGMTEAQVIAACGQPASQRDSERPLTQKIPIQQLVYNNLGTKTGFYGVWTIPMGSGGTQLDITIVNQKVRTFSMNGSSDNAVSVCGGVNIQPGDTVQKVYNACGSPSIVNNSFIEEVVPTAEKPKAWVYQPGQSQPSVSLTFVNGRLQSIQQ